MFAHEKLQVYGKPLDFATKAAAWTSTWDKNNNSFLKDFSWENLSFSTRHCVGLSVRLGSPHDACERGLALGYLGSVLRVLDWLHPHR